MKSKPFGALFGLLALVAILGVVPAFGQEASDVTITTGAGASASADCVAASNCFSPNPLTVAPGTTVTWTNNDTVSHTITSGKLSDNDTGSMFDSNGLDKTRKDIPIYFCKCRHIRLLLHCPSMDDRSSNSRCSWRKQLQAIKLEYH